MRPSQRTPPTPRPRRMRTTRRRFSPAHSPEGSRYHPLVIRGEVFVLIGFGAVNITTRWRLVCCAVIGAVLCDGAPLPHTLRRAFGATLQGSCCAVTFAASFVSENYYTTTVGLLHVCCSIFPCGNCRCPANASYASAALGFRI